MVVSCFGKTESDGDSLILGTPQMFFAPAVVGGQLPCVVRHVGCSFLGKCCVDAASPQAMDLIVVTTLDRSQA